MAGGAARAARVCRRGERLARGRDRDRRLAARRAVQPARRAHRGHRRRLEGLRPLDSVLRPARRRSVRARSCSGGGADIARRPASRSPRRTSRPSRRRSPPRRGRARRGRSRARGAIDAVVTAAASSTLDLCAELARLAPFGLGNPASTLLAPGCELAELATVGDGKHLRFRVRRDGGDARQRDRVRRRGRGSTRCGPTAARTSRSGSRRTTGTAQSSPQLVVRRIFARGAALPRAARLARRRMEETRCVTRRGARRDLRRARSRRGRSAPRPARVGAVPRAARRPSRRSPKPRDPGRSGAFAD